MKSRLAKNAKANCLSRDKLTDSSGRQQIYVAAGLLNRRAPTSIDFALIFAEDGLTFGR